MDAPDKTTDSGRRARRRGGPRSWLALILFMLVLLAGVKAADTLYRRLLAPWSIETAGGPALFGTWSGPVNLEDGVSGTMLLTLVDTLSWQEELLDPLIEGSAHYCLGDVSGDFEVYGHVDRQGSVADLRFRSNIDDPVWLLYGMSSSWLRSPAVEDDTLVLTGTYSYDPSAQHISRSDVPEPAITVTLHRGDADPDCPAPGS
jgi:hypothetical protein